jgi:hypothetical protein
MLRVARANDVRIKFYQGAASSVDTWSIYSEAVAFVAVLQFLFSSMPRRRPCLGLNADDPFLNLFSRGFSVLLLEALNCVP